MKLSTRIITTSIFLAVFLHLGNCYFLSNWICQTFPCRLSIVERDIAELKKQVSILNTQNQNSNSRNTNQNRDQNQNQMQNQGKVNSDGLVHSPLNPGDGSYRINANGYPNNVYQQQSRAQLR